MQPKSKQRESFFPDFFFSVFDAVHFFSGKGFESDFLSGYNVSNCRKGVHELQPDKTWLQNWRKLEFYKTKHKKYYKPFTKQLEFIAE